MRDYPQSQHTTQYSHYLYSRNENLVFPDDVIREGEGLTQESRGGEERGKKRVNLTVHVGETCAVKCP